MKEIPDYFQMKVQRNGRRLQDHYLLKHNYHYNSFILSLIRKPCFYIIKNWWSLIQLIQSSLGQVQKSVKLSRLKIIKFTILTMKEVPMEYQH